MSISIVELMLQHNHSLYKNKIYNSFGYVIFETP